MWSLIRSSNGEWLSDPAGLDQRPTPGEGQEVLAIPLGYSMDPPTMRYDPSVKGFRDIGPSCPVDLLAVMTPEERMALLNHFVEVGVLTSARARAIGGD